MAREYVVITDATCDLPIEVVNKFGIVVVPMEFQMKDVIYINDGGSTQMKSTEFYKRLKEGGSAITSQINFQTYIEYFSPFLKDKDILYISFSSNLSGTYQASKMAIEELEIFFPHAKMISIDSLCASVGEGLLVYEAMKKKGEGLSIEELASWIEEKKRSVCHWFTVDDLNHLRRGGRLSVVSAVIGSALGIKPILHVSDDGSLQAVSKARGRKKSMEKLILHMEACGINKEMETIFIAQADCEDDALILKAMIIEAFGTKNVIITEMGPIIGSHAGPGTLLIGFFGKVR